MTLSLSWCRKVLTPLEYCSLPVLGALLLGTAVGKGVLVVVVVLAGKDESSREDEASLIAALPLSDVSFA